MGLNAGRPAGQQVPLLAESSQPLALFLKMGSLMCLEFTEYTNLAGQQALGISLSQNPQCHHTQVCNLNSREGIQIFY